MAGSQFIEMVRPACRAADDIFEDRQTDRPNESRRMFWRGWIG
jgi:hypothetical protein